MNRKSELYAVFIVLIFILSISIPALLESAAAQEKVTRDSRKPARLTIGILPEKNIFEQRKRYEAITLYISRQLDMNVHVETLANYTSIPEAFSDGTIDAAFFGSFSYILTRNMVPIEPLARPVWTDGSSTYRGYIFTRKDSGIKTVADMEGKSLVLVDKATTAGYLYPVFYLKEYGIDDIEKFFSSVYFAGSHDGSAWAVYKGEAAVGACKNHVFQSMAAEHPQFRERMVVLAESPEVPSNGLGIRSDLNESLKKQLKDLLLNLDKSEEGRSVLNKMGAVRFIPTSDEDYAPLYEMIDKLKLELDIFLDRN